jgi:hypothetical protein
LLLAQGLPPLSEDLANLACTRRARSAFVSRPGGQPGALTKGDAFVLSSDIITLLVGKEHVGGKTTLGCVGIWKEVSAHAPDLEGDDERLALFGFTSLGSLGLAGSLFLRHDV